MARQLEATAQVKQAIQLLGISNEHLRHFTDKRKTGRRLKFYGIEPNDAQIQQLNDWFKFAGISAKASIASKMIPANLSTMHWSTRRYSYNKLTVHVTI